MNASDLDHLIENLKTAGDHASTGQIILNNATIDGSYVDTTQWVSPSVDTVVKTPYPGITHIGDLTTGTYTGTLAAAKPKLDGVSISEDEIKIKDYNGEVLMVFNLKSGDIIFNPDFSIAPAAAIFWEAIMKTGVNVVARSEYDRVNQERAKLYEEHVKTKALLDKALKELGKKYNEEAETL